MNITVELDSKEWELVACCYSISRHLAAEILSGNMNMEVIPPLLEMIAATFSALSGQKESTELIQKLSTQLPNLQLIEVNVREISSKFDFMDALRKAKEVADLEEIARKS